MINQDRSEWPSEAELISELKATYPGLSVRPLREFGAPGFDCGVWAGGDCVMPGDDMPIFSNMTCSDFAIYNGKVHRAFEAWLEPRGWYAANYDGVTHLIVPIAQAVGEGVTHGQ